MALNPSACVDDELACSTLYSYAEHLKCAAMEALDGCFPSGSCRDQIRAYLSMGAGDDGIANTLIVVAGPMLPSTNTAAVGPSLFNVSFDVRLRESGYPMIAAVDGGRAIAAPDPELQDSATRQSMAHGEAIMRRLSAMKSSGGLTPPGFHRCVRGSISQMLPLPPQGGVVGWSIIVQMTIPWA